MVKKIRRLAMKIVPDISDGCRDDSPGKRLAWEVLSQMQYPEPEFDRDYPIGKVVFDFYSDVLHLAIDIIDTDKKYNPEERQERIRIVYKHDLLHFSWPAEKIINDIDSFLYCLDFYISSRRKQSKFKKYGTDLQTNHLLSKGKY